MVVKILLSWPEKQHVSWFISCGITHDDIWVERVLEIIWSLTEQCAICGVTVKIHWSAVLLCVTVAPMLKVALGDQSTKTTSLIQRTGKRNSQIIPTPNLLLLK